MKPFTKISSILFALIAVAHLARVVFGWTATVNGSAVPMWVSIVAAVISGVMSVMLCREACCKPAAATA